MASIVVIGYGNPLRGDDAVGYLVASELARQYSSDQVDVIACHQLNPELSEAISTAAMVLFIDAALGGAPGETFCRRVRASGAGAFTHQLDASGLLACAQALWGCSPEAVVMGIHGEAFSIGQQLSPAVRAALPKVIRLASELIEAQLGRGHGVTAAVRGGLKPAL